MQLSARNVIKGTIKAMEIGVVNAEVILEISSGVEMASVITKDSAETLGLEVGKEVFAVVKASDVMIAVE
jgi:molybdopterin-binding protein